MDAGLLPDRRTRQSTDRQTGRFTEYPFGPGAAGVASGNLLADGENGFWVASSQGLQYFDRGTERYTYQFRHDETSPDSLDDDMVVTVYRDKAGLLWVGTDKGGLNLLDWRQQQFGLYRHRPGDPNSLSPGKVTAVYQEPSGIVWVGFFPRALDRVDPRTGRVVHYVPGDGKNGLGAGDEVNSIYKDARGDLWLSGWAAGLDRLDERTGQFTHYRYSPRDPNGLMSDNVFALYGDRAGQLWIGQANGLSRLDPVTGQFTHYPQDPGTPTNYGRSAQAFYEDRSGTLWVARGNGVVSRFDAGTKSFVNYAPDSRDPNKLSGGAVRVVHEDKAGTLWFGAWDGLYRYDRPHGTFARYTESSGLPSSTIQGILEDDAGRLWLATMKGISRFDPRTQTFRNYDVSDGLQGDDFSRACFRRPAGEMFFGGSNGLNAFFAEAIRDDPYVPPVVITSFKRFNRPVPIGSASILKRAIPYVESLTLSHADNVFSLEFAALSYANAHKNRYRYRLEKFEPAWNEVDSGHRLATYTNLDPGRYVFRVQGSNGDGVWNEAGVSLPILVTPPWWRTNWFRATAAGLFLALLWAAHQYRVRQLQHAFDMTLEGRVGERTRIARELHDTLLQSFHGLLLRFQTALYLLPDRPEEARQKLSGAIEQAAKAITEGRDVVQGLRASTVERNDLALAIKTLGDELATDVSAGPLPTLSVTVEGPTRDLRPIVRDEIYKIAAEALRNSFGHAQAGQVEVEIRYDSDHFRLRVRDDGKGIDQAVLAAQGIEGHYGLRGMPERAALVGGKLTVWSEAGAGTEVELRLPASAVYATSRRRFW